MQWYVHRQPVLGKDEQTTLGTLPLRLLHNVEPADAAKLDYYIIALGNVAPGICQLVLPASPDTCCKHPLGQACELVCRQHAHSATSASEWILCLPGCKQGTMNIMLADTMRGRASTARRMWQEAALD